MLSKSIEFTSKRLTFRPSWTADSNELATAGNDFDIALAIGTNFPHPYTVADADAYKKYTQEAWEAGTEYCFGIFETATGTYIGNIGFDPSESPDTIRNIGYWLTKSEHGKGYATEALRRTLELIRAEFPKVKKVLAAAKEYNTASQHVLEKCGFVKTGELTEPEILQNGKPSQSVKFELTIN